jgi:hypothetical protein
MTINNIPYPDVNHIAGVATITSDGAITLTACPETHISNISALGITFVTTASSFPLIVDTSK